MKIPDMQECRQLLARYGYKWELGGKHAEGVMHVAAYLAEKLKENGADIDVKLCTAAALLHDLDEDIITNKASQHGKKSQEVLIAEGYPEIGRIVSKHFILTIEHQPLATWEEKVVYAADKLFADKLMTAQERVLDMARRHPQHKAHLMELLPKVQDVVDEVLAKAKVTVEDIKRKIKP